MATQNHTVTNHSYALNVVDLVTVKTAKKYKIQNKIDTSKMRIMRRQSILPTTKVANIIIT